MSQVRNTAIAAVAAAFLLLALGVSPAAAAEPTAPTGPVTEPAPEYVDTELSDEQTLSRWAFVTRKAIARSEPKNGGRKVRKLTTRTPDGTHELVLVLKERTYQDGSKWVQVRLPMRGSGRTGWLRRGILGSYRSVRTHLVISRNRFRATLYRSGKTVWSARIGIGKKGTVTPAGNFYIRNKLIVSRPGGPYGPYAMGLSAYSPSLSDWPGGGIIGIHGTNQPGILPGRVSHGCIRVKNSKIRKLYRIMPPGTPVTVE
ncbi:MAG: L,D-transpeptidase [Actinobacteria bacterium]|nr:L,D-transpeptidase [Actinomycetota bacterium]